MITLQTSRYLAHRPWEDRHHINDSAMFPKKEVIERHLRKYRTWDGPHLKKKDHRLIGKIADTFAQQTCDQFVLDSMLCEGMLDSKYFRAANRNEFTMYFNRLVTALLRCPGLQTLEHDEQVTGMERAIFSWGRRASP